MTQANTKFDPEADYILPGLPSYPKGTHTPGPWRYNGLAGIIGANGVRCANVWVTGEVELELKETVANGNLIAAAPELLEACQHAISHTNNVDWQLLADAIAKATGQEG